MPTIKASAPLCVISRGQLQLLTASVVSQAGWGDTGTQDDSAGDNSVPQETELARERGAASDREDFPPGQVLVQPKKLCSCGGLPCTVSPLGTGSAILVPSLSPCASAVEIPPSLLPGRGDPGSKREIFGVGSAPQATDPPPPASPAGLNHLLSCTEALKSSETLSLLAAAFLCPYGHTWAS